MVIAQSTAVGIERQFAHARDQVAIHHEFAAFPFFAKAQVFQLHQHGDSEAVVQGGILDVGRGDTCFRKSHRTRKCCGRIGQVNLTTHAMFRRFACAAHHHKRASVFARELPRNFRARHNQGTTAIAHHAAVQTVQWIAHHRGVDHLLDRHQIAQHGVDVVLCMVRCCNLDPGQLFAGSAKLVHVSFGHQCVEILRGWAIGQLKGQFGRIGVWWFQGQGRLAGPPLFGCRLSGHHLRTRPARQSNKCNAAPA